MCSRCRFGQQRKWYVLHIAITCSLYDGPLRYKIVKTKITQQPLYCSLFIPLRPFFLFDRVRCATFSIIAFFNRLALRRQCQVGRQYHFLVGKCPETIFPALSIDCGLYCLKFYVHRMPSALLFGFHRYNIITQMDFHGHFTWHLWRFLDTLILTLTLTLTLTHNHSDAHIQNTDYLLAIYRKKIIASEHSYIQIGRYKNLNNCHNDLHWTFRIKNCASFGEIHRMTESSIQATQRLIHGMYLVQLNTTEHTHNIEKMQILRIFACTFGAKH